MRKNLKRLAVVGVIAGGVVSMSTAANAQTIAVVQNPTNGCTYTLYGPTVTIVTYPPKVSSAGGFGESVSCP